MAELSKLRKRKRRKSGYKPVSDSHVDWQKTAHKAKRKFAWGWVILLAIVLTLFLFAAFFSSKQVPAPVTMSGVPETVLKKREPEKEVQAGELATEKKEKPEVFYMGIKIS